jgi:hypothetical protein
VEPVRASALLSEERASAPQLQERPAQPGSLPQPRTRNPSHSHTRLLPRSACGATWPFPHKNLPKHSHSNSSDVRSNPGPSMAPDTAPRTPSNTPTTDDDARPKPERPALLRRAGQPSKSIAWTHSFCSDVSSGTSSARGLSKMPDPKPRGKSRPLVFCPSAPPLGGPLGRWCVLHKLCRIRKLAPRALKSWPHFAWAAQSSALPIFAQEIRGGWWVLGRTTYRGG